MLAPIGSGAATPSAYVYNSASTERQYPPPSSNGSENKIVLRLDATETNDPAEYYAKAQINAAVLEAKAGLERAQTNLATVEVVDEDDLRALAAADEKMEVEEESMEGESSSSVFASFGTEPEPASDAIGEKKDAIGKDLDAAMGASDAKEQTPPSEEKQRSAEVQAQDGQLTFGVGSNLMEFRFEIAAGTVVE